jgi:DNA mismatch endonuclease, patch repair protein
MDFLTKERRSQLMSRIRGTNTKPEQAVRSIVQRLGYKFRTCQASLPARPDLAFPSMRKVILVHGCFWHRHYRCPKATMPKTRVAFWRNKFEQNKLRDRSKLRQLRKLGWAVLTVWECETSSPNKLRDRIRQYLETP